MRQFKMQVSSPDQFLEVVGKIMKDNDFDDRLIYGFKAHPYLYVNLDFDEPIHRIRIGSIRYAFVEHEYPEMQATEFLSPVKHPHHDLMMWWAESRSNEVEVLCSDTWREAVTPLWCVEDQYRKREKPPTQERNNAEFTRARAKDQYCEIEVWSWNDEWTKLRPDQSVREGGEYRFPPSEMDLEVERIVQNPELLEALKRHLADSE